MAILVALSIVFVSTSSTDWTVLQSPISGPSADWTAIMARITREKLDVDDALTATAHLGIELIISFEHQHDTPAVDHRVHCKRMISDSRDDGKEESELRGHQRHKSEDGRLARDS